MNSQKLVKDIQKYCDSMNAYKEELKEIQKKHSSPATWILGNRNKTIAIYALILCLIVSPLAVLTPSLLWILGGVGIGLISTFAGLISQKIALKSKDKVGRYALACEAIEYVWCPKTYKKILRKGYVTYKDIDKLKKENEKNKNRFVNFSNEILKKCNENACSNSVDSKSAWSKFANELQCEGFHRVGEATRKLLIDLEQLKDIDTSLMTKEELNKPIIIKNYEVEDFKVNNNKKANTQTSKVYTTDKTYEKDDEYTK